MQCVIALPVVKSMTVLVTGLPLTSVSRYGARSKAAQPGRVCPAIGDDLAVVLDEDRDALAIFVTCQRQRSDVVEHPFDDVGGLDRRCRRAGSSGHVWDW